MSKKPLTRAELKRLEQLQKQLEIKESKLNVQEAKLKKQKKDVESQQRKVATERKQLQNERKQLKQDKDFVDKTSKNLSRPKSGDRPFSAQKTRKLKEDYAALKKKHEHFAKLMRDYKKKADQLDAENKVLKKRVQNANNKKLPTNDKQLRSLMKENRWLKKKLRELMKDLAKQKRWYNRVVKVFKDNNNKWVQKKIEAYKDKEYIIKYIFLDDIKRIVLTRPGHDRNGFKPRVRIKNGRGGQVVLRNVGIDVFDQKVRKRDRNGKRDRKGGNNNGSGKGRNSKDVITKARPGKDGKNIIKTKYVDKGDTESINKEKAAKKGPKGSAKNTPTPDDSTNNNNNTKKKNKRSNSKADPATSEFLVSEPTSPGASAEDGTAGAADGGDAGDAAGDAGGAGAGDGEDIDSKEIDEDEWDTLPDPQDALDDYMIEFMREIGIDVTKDDLDKMEDKMGDDGKDDEAAEDAKLDKEFADALKTDKELMFDGDGETGSQELQAQIMYMVGEMDSRNEDIKQLKDIANGVQYVAGTGTEEEDMEEKELKTTKEKMDALELVFASMQQRQEAFIASLDELNCDTDAIRDINDNFCDQYHTLAKMALTGGGGENGRKNFEKLRYFVDYFMKELIGRMYDLRCVNAAYYNQGVDSIRSNDPEANTPSSDDAKDEAKDNEEDRPVFEVLQSGIDDRHNNIQELVSKDEVMNKDNSEDKVGADIERVLNDFLGNIDDWKSLIEETKQKHATWIEKRGTLLNALAVRHSEMSELMNKINDVPSYSMNLQKWAPKDDEINDNIASGSDNDNENENENENEADSGAQDE